MIVPPSGGCEETHTFKDYCRTEHISRKLGQWHPDPKGMTEHWEKKGFCITGNRFDDP